MSNRKVYLGIGIFIFILYGVTLFNGYSIDDYLVVEDNQLIQQGLKAIPQIFTEYSFTNWEGVKSQYRPIVLLSFAIEYQIFGENLFINHLINVLLYWLFCVLLFKTMQILLKDYNPYLPLLITVLFVAHPIHTEVVCSLKNRDELFALGFGIGAIYLNIKAVLHSNWKLYWSAIALFIIAILSKLTCVPLVGIIFLINMTFLKVTFKKNVLNTLGFAVIVFLFFISLKVYFPLTFDRLSSFTYVENHLAFEKNIFKLTASSFYALAYNLRLLFYPHPLGFFYGYKVIPVVNWNNWIAISSLIIHLAMLVYALLNLSKQRVISFGILFYLLSIVLYSNLILPVPGAVADRLLFFPSIAFCIIIADLLLKIFNIKSGSSLKEFMKPSLTGALVVILTLYSVKTIARSTQWKDHLTLSQRDARVIKDSAIMHFYCVIMLNKKLSSTQDQNERNKITRKSINHLKEVIRIYPDYAQAYNYLGGIYQYDVGNSDSASYYYSKANDIWNR